STGDGCGGTVGISYSDAPPSPHFTGKPGVNRTLYAVDACGNTNSCVPPITFLVTTRPVLSGFPSPASTNVQCYSQVPTAPTVTASDNCSGDLGAITPVVMESKPGSSCSNVITRTWTATDNCGNSTNCMQTIIVNDTTKPIITCPP